MKILKYVIFISIFSSLFFVIYCQSDRKNFWRCFRMGAVMSGVLAGLIPAPVEAYRNQKVAIGVNSLEKQLEIEILGKSGKTQLINGS